MTASDTGATATIDSRTTGSSYGLTLDNTVNKTTYGITSITTGTTSNQYTVNLPASAGTLALTSQIPSLPSYSSSDSGKILSVNSSGALVWITPSSIYSGSGTPSNSTGNNGDIYLQS